MLTFHCSRPRDDTEDWETDVDGDREEVEGDYSVNAGDVGGYYSVLIGHAATMRNDKMLDLIEAAVVDDGESTNPGRLRVLNQVPQGIQRNSAFVVNLHKLRDPDDITLDGNGVWMPNQERCPVSPDVKYSNKNVQ